MVNKIQVPSTKFQAPNSTATAYSNCHYPLQTTDYRPQTPDQIPSTKYQVPTNYFLLLLFLDLSIRGLRTRFRIQDIRKLTTAPKEARKTVMTTSSIPIKLRDDRKVPPAVPIQMEK